MPGQDTVQAISNNDGGNDTITVDGGAVTANGTFSRVIGMGLVLESGSVSLNLNSGSGSLRLSGTEATYGMVTYGGSVNIGSNGTLTIDKGLYMDGGGTTTVFGGCTLTLGQNAGSNASVMYGAATINLFGSLIAHGGFSMSGGTFNTDSNSASITVDAGNAFTLSVGSFELGGNVTVSGNFTADGGTITDYFASTSFYTISVNNGNLTLSANCTFTVPTGTRPPPGPYSILSCTGTVNGDFTYSLPAGWTDNWNPAHDELTITVPNA